MALSFNTLAPFYADFDERLCLAARVNVGDAVLVKKVLPRFVNRDDAEQARRSAAKLPGLVDRVTNALGLSGRSDSVTHQLRSDRVPRQRRTPAEDGVKSQRTLPEETRGVVWHRGRTMTDLS